MTTDADLDLRLRRWLASDAVATAPAGLRRRVLEIPTARTGSSVWHRFVAVPLLTAAVAAVTIGAVVLSGWFFTLFDRVPGVDGGLCNNRQLQRALDELRDTDGYRYLDIEQRQVLLSDPSTSLDDPVFGWTDTLTSTVAYLAPDRTHEVVTPIADGSQRGYLEQVRIGNRQWQLREIDGQPTWISDTPWPLGNWAWGYVQNAMGVLGTPGIASIRFGSEPVPDGLTGDGGCTIAAPGETETRIVALRVGTDGRVSDIYLGPPAHSAPNRDAWRNLIALDYMLPDASEFVAPSSWVDHDDLYPTVSIRPQPTIGPLTAPEGGWEPVPFPLPDADLVGASVGGIVDAAGGWVAVGSAQVGDYDFRGLAWTSADGIRWELADLPPGFDGVSFSELVWNQETFMAVGYRPQERADDGTADPDRPESWLSTDGIAWQPGGMFEAGANPGRPIWTDAGWIAAGSMWSGNEQRPAFFSSADGVSWTTIRPRGAAYGSIGRPEIDPDGTIHAQSCETPEETNTAGGSPCFVRKWTSTDGVTWTPGPASEDTDDDLLEVAEGDGFLAIRSNAATGEVELVRSDDGTAWQPIALPADSIYPAQLIEIPDAVLLIGHASDTPGMIASLWRTADAGDTWQEVPLGVLPEAVGRWIDRVIATDSGLRIFGSMYVDEISSVPVVWIEP